jgi:hypothetical protein
VLPPIKQWVLLALVFTPNCGAQFGDGEKEVQKKVLKIRWM